MPFPAGLTLVTVHCQFDALPDGGASGTVQITSSVVLLGATDNSIVAAPGATGVLDADGECTLQLPATNDPQWSPSGWSYRVQANVGSHTVRGTLQLDYQTTSVELADLLQVDGAAAAGTTYATLAQLTTVATELDAAEADITAVETRVGVLEDRHRRLVSAASVLPRAEVTGPQAMATGTLFATHFRADRTATIGSLRTYTGGSSTVGVGATHAWIGILAWDGTTYTPITQSVDDPTRWAAEFATYDTQLMDDFAMAAGTEYAMYLLWIGSGQAPSLPGGQIWYADSLLDQRMCALINDQTQQPAAPISGAFFGPDSRRFQAHLVPA